MNPGRMDRQITIERKTETRDAVGYPVPSWSPLATVWAEVRPLSGREALRSGEALGRVIGSETASFFIYHTDGLTIEDRINYDGKIWNIRYIREIGRRDGLEILAEVLS